MTTGGAIDPAGIPHFTGNLDEVEKSATGVHTAAKNLAEHGHGVHSTFQGLSAFYQAPEAEKLFSSTHTIPTKADSLKGELFTVATALEDYATAVRPIVQRIEHIRAQAVTFAASVEGDDNWHKDADKVNKNTGLRSDLAAALEDFATAQNDCANKISALVGGRHYMLNPTGDKALIPKNAAFNGYSADAWEHAEKTPWGAPVEREYEGVEWLLHQTKSLVWDGFVINGFLGTLDGLSTLVGAKGLDQAGQAWKGLADAAGGLSQYLMTPYDWVLDHTLGPAEESPTEKHQKEALKGLVKGFVAYDDWKENPARAAGTFGFNALTAAAGAGGGAAARGGAGARVVAGLGKAGRFVDPMTYIGKAGSFTVVKVGDAFSALKSLHGTPTTVHLADGGSFTAHEPTAGLPERPAAIPRGAIPGTDELGRTVYLDPETGHLLNADGTIHQHVNDAARELPAEQRAAAHSDTTTPVQAAHEPELVGAHATGDNLPGATAHTPGGAAGGFAHGASASHETPGVGGHIRGSEHTAGGGTSHDSTPAVGDHATTGHGAAGAGGEGGTLPPTGGHDLPGAGAVPEPPRGNLPDGSWEGENGLHLSPHANAAADDFIGQSAEAEPRITDTLQQITRNVDDGRLIGLEYRLKGEDSLKRKLATDLSEYADLTEHDALARIKDSIRYTVEMPNSGYTHGVQQAVDTLRAGGFENVTFKNTWDSAGYKGINSTWRDPVTGRTFEVQFHTPDSFAAKMDGHLLYEKERLPGVSAEDLAAIKAEQHHLFGQVPVPHDAGHIHLSPHAHDAGGAHADSATNPDAAGHGPTEHGTPPDRAGPYASGAGYVTEPSEYAGRLYEQIRATPNKVDLPEIARHTGVDESVLRQVKSHLFRAQHDVPVGPGQVKRGLFEPRDDVADLWLGARRGNLPADKIREFKNLLSHEYVESQLMKAGLPYSFAHEHLYSAVVDNGVFDGHYRNFPEDLRDAGAHELAPNPTKGGFAHWERALGLTPPAVKLADDLSNIDEIMKAVVKELRVKGVNLG